MGQEGDNRAENRYTVRSVARACDLIDIVAEGPDDGLTLSEIARALGVSKSTALATIRTLLGRRYLRASGSGARYRLGPVFIGLADIVTNQAPIADMSRTLLRELSEATGMTARVAVPDQGYPVYIARVDGPGRIRFHAPLGRREPPHTTAGGKAILATMTDDEVRALIAEAGLPRRTANTITNVETLLDTLHRVRDRGFAVDDEEDAEGVFCVGAAFFDHRGACVGAFSCTGIKTDLPLWRIDELGRTVRGYADRMSELLGGRPDGPASPAATGSREEAS